MDPSLCNKTDARAPAVRPVSNCEGEALQNLNTPGAAATCTLTYGRCEAIVQKEDSIQSFQKWWSEGHGDHAAASNCLLRTAGT